MTGRQALLDRAVDYLSRAGIGDISLRRLAEELGTSHRMVIYHFGSRDGLLTAVVAEVERQQRDLLDAAMDPERPTLEQGRRYWQAVATAAERHGRLFFELAAHAMQDREHARPLQRGLIDPWLPPMERLCRKLDVPEEDCAATARLALAAARGLLFDLLLTGDRDAVDAAADRLNQLLVRGSLRS
ncbi:TetR/AcrR family transcriptional regulator [Microlunatus parietis]|uniref:AcrR family transcriptional regulator n=1 Tax=Microlunatus parietis TaxID=682979 RepID=A0A7Y9I8A9_9ACTN|nr:helix-turn-helix domain-containing protein [Microlunatus parietis]NYE72027.1 AcrR family transcriptional regulator [Microlunatus parietis]